MAIETIHPEIDQRPQIFETQPQHDRTLEVLFNHPGRALTYLVAATAPEALHTPASLSIKLNEAKGTLSCPQDLHTYTRAYCSNMLVPAGLLTATSCHDKNGNSILAYRVDSQNLAFRIAAAATIIDWQLQFPQLNPSQIVGETRLTADEAMPLTSLKIFAALLDTSLKIQSHSDLEAHLGRPLHRNLRTLVKNGILEKRSKYSTFHDRSIALEDPGKSYESRYYKRFGKAAKAVYEAAARLRLQRITIVSSKDLIAEVIAHKPDVSEAEIRNILGRNPPNGISYGDQADFNGKLTHFEISETLRPAVADLTLRYQNLISSPAFVKAGIARAGTILKDQVAVGLVIEKSKPKSDDMLAIRTMHRDPGAVTRNRLGSLTLQRLPIESGWTSKAHCREDEDPDIFFPISETGATIKQIEIAKGICRTCPVVASCLQFSLDTRQQFGIFGGMTPEERRAYRTKPRVDELQQATNGPRTNKAISVFFESAAQQARPIAQYPA
jgi:WhiB family redox-sensing transcriptional regulator